MKIIAYWLMTTMVILQSQTICLGESESIIVGDRNGGYCGRDALEYGLRFIGVEVLDKPEVRKLSELPLVTLEEIYHAGCSLDLQPIRQMANKDNLTQLLTKFPGLGSYTIGIAWVKAKQPANISDNIGHFVVMDGILANGNVRLVDPQSQTIFEFELTDGRSLPVVFFTTKNRPESIINSTANYNTISSALVFALMGCLMFFIGGNKTFNIKNSLPQRKLLSLLALALLACGLSIYYWPKISATIWRPWHAVETKELSRSGFAKAEFNFGQLVADKGLSMEVPFINSSETQVEVTSIKGSCGCMHVTPNQFIVAPGGKQTVSIVFDTFVDGDNQYSLKANIGDDNKNSSVCQILFNAVRNHRLTPESTFLGSFSLSEPSNSLYQVFRIEGAGMFANASARLLPRLDNSPLEIELATDAVSADSTIELVVKPKSDTTHRGHYYETVRVEIPNADTTLKLVVEIGVDVVN